jgi:cytochrome c peroxidase
MMYRKQWLRGAKAPMMIAAVASSTMLASFMSSAGADDNRRRPSAPIDQDHDAEREAMIESLERIIEGLESATVQGSRAQPLPAPVTDADYPARDIAKEDLGRLLFFDKILSGNMNTSCATCHHPLTGTGDGLSLSVGEGAMGLGVTRNTGEGADAAPERVPRNAPHLFNVGALEFVRMFHDGRVEVDASQPSGFSTPAGDDLPSNLDSALAAQAMFPVTSTTEMAGQAGENAIADLAATGDLPGVWEALAARVRAVPEYVAMFVGAFDDVEEADDITLAHAANAIAAWEAAAFRADQSPFDRFLRGDRAAMSPSQKKGMRLFYRQAGCAECHSGVFQTNQEFRAAAMPQIGPGKGDNLPGYSDGHDDFGRERVTGEITDRFRFRVPTLRNVSLTGPWGHSGAYNSLEAVARHMKDPTGSLESYDATQAVLPPRGDLDALDFVAHQDAERREAIAAACEAPTVALREKQFGQLMDFLHALTDPYSLDLRGEVPMTVPSGLPVFD